MLIILTSYQRNKKRYLTKKTHIGLIFSKIEQMTMNDFNIIERGNIPKDYWVLLQYAVMGDIERLAKIVKRINQDGKILVAVYPGVPELMKGIDISEMEFVGSIIDGALYLK